MFVLLVVVSFDPIPSKREMLISARLYLIVCVFPNKNMQALSFGFF